MIATKEQTASVETREHCLHCSAVAKGVYYIGRQRVCRKCWYEKMYEPEEDFAEFSGFWALVWGVIGWVVVGGIAYGLWALYAN